MAEALISEIHSKGVWTEPTFRTFEQSVAASSRSHRAARADQENPQLEEAEILEYSLLIDAVDLLLSDDRVLHVFLDGDKVEWQYLPAEAFRKAPRIYADRVLVYLPGEEPYAWEPDALLAARKGIKSLFLGPALTFLTLELRGQPELRFAKTVLTDGGQVLQFHPG